MPPLPSPTVSNRAPPQTKTTSKPSAASRRPGSASSVRRPTSAASTRNGTPTKTTQHNDVYTRLQQAPKSRHAPSSKDGSGDSKRSERVAVTRRQSSSTSVVAARERAGSKDGMAQREAKEVEGLKDYQLGDCLGRGAFGAVYRALNWSTGETVAIKSISLSHLPHRASDLTTIMQEIDLLKNLNHPNIVKYHGFVKSSDHLYIILEYCENGSLHSICKNFGKFPENLVSLYTAQVLQGLLFLHEQGVIHRDIKGANILTTKEGLVKLADFGVATRQADGSSVVGTPYWMAPEVIELSGASTASDIWSLGCTVIELLDGKPPYHKLQPMPALFRIVNDDHPPLPEGVSPLVRDFLMQCFQKDPNLRVSAKKLLKHPWILSSKKSDVGKPVKHEDALKYVEEWNEALKSSPKSELAGNGGSRRASAKAGASRPTSRAGAKAAKAKHEAVAANISAGPRRTVFQLGPKESKPAPSSVAHVEEHERDNWDEDFESLSTSFGALQLPDHHRPQDQFAGLFTAEKLKRYATEPIPEVDGKVEQWDEEFPDVELMARSPRDTTGSDALETMRPLRRAKTTYDVNRRAPKSTVVRNDAATLRTERKASKESEPRTQILKSMQKLAEAPKTNRNTTASTDKQVIKATLANDKDKFREDEEEDYSDLVPDDDTAFQRKLAGFSPSRPYNPRDLRQIQTKINGSVRRRTHTPTNLVHDAAAMKRTRSSMEIQKYAEDEDEDFGDVIFGDGDDGTPIQLHPLKQRSPQSAASISGDSASGGGASETGTMKLSGSVATLWASPDEEDDDEDDPFAALEEELDEVDLESNVARDKHARLCTQVEGFVSDLKVTQPEDVLSAIVDKLLLVLEENPDVKSVVVSSHGMLPILEILDTCQRPNIVLSLLRIVNTISSDNMEVQENLCFVGGIPIITKFAHKRFGESIRLEAASFVRMMYQTSTLTLQMFVACGGLNVLVEFLEEEYDHDTGRELVLLGVNGVWSVFALQGPTPKNDFCRIFSRSQVLYPLSLVLSKILDEEEDEMADVFEGRIANIFLLFSQAENHVKETVADRMVLKRVLKDLRRMRPQHQITMLKFIKNLSMLATTLDALQNSNAIEVLTDLLSSSMKERAPHFRELSNQVLNTMYNLCRLSKARQEDAALNGLVPLLQRIVQSDRPLKEFALPILCDMAHSGKVGRKVLWQNKGLQFYVWLLGADQYWAVTALDAIFVWLQEETSKVEEVLLSTSAFADAIMRCFNESKADAFENLLEPLQKLLRLSTGVAASLAQKPLFERCGVKLHYAKKPLVRLNLLRVLRGICEAHEEGGALIDKYGLLDSVQELLRTDPAILVREIAKDLVVMAEHASPAAGTPGGARYAGMRRSSSSLVTPSLGGSIPPTPGSGLGERASSRSELSDYFELGMDLSRTRPIASSPYRPVSRDASSSSSTTSQQYGTGATSMPPKTNTGRAPAARSSIANLRPMHSRLSLVTSGGVGSRTSMGNGVLEKARENITPTRAPVSANTRSAAIAANARRRRQTSGVADLGRHS